MEYKTITSGWASIDSAVNERIADGWIPIGGISTSNIDGIFRLHQAMTRNKPRAIKKAQLSQERSPSVESDFNRFWLAYGKKGNRKTSLARYSKLNNVQHSAMSAHLPKYVKSTPDKRFRKNFEVYINQECWNDEIQVNTGILPAVKTQTPEQKKISADSVWKRQGFKSEREYSDYLFNKQMEDIKK